MVGRRTMIVGSAATVGALGLSYPLLEVFRARNRTAQIGPYGALRTEPGSPLALPEGFTCHVLEEAGAAMSDGFRVPARADGMACFLLPDGSWSLMRNHENPPAPSGSAWSGPAPESAWSQDGLGAVTRVVIDPETVSRRSSNLVLGGTILNCAGGPSPWGWLSCEEAFDRRHGQVFVCDPLADSMQTPRPVPGYGKFRHEAVAVEPHSHVAYLSEDRDDSCLYRFVPHDPQSPFDGQLYALRVRGHERFDTGTRLHRPDQVEFDWIPLEDTSPERDDLRYRAQAAGAASFSRGEGITRTAEGSLVLCATSGGPARNGQVLRLEPESEGGTLSVVAQATDDDLRNPTTFSMPDNIVASPHDGMVFFCEDNHVDNGVVGIDRAGAIFDFARNRLSRSELAGVCFSPDGRAMFVNIQEQGLTLAIVGPWQLA